MDAGVVPPLETCTVDVSIDLSDRDDVASVVIAGGAPLSWTPSSADPLSEDAGVWSTSVDLPPGAYPHKFVISGDEWVQDVPNCHFSSDGFGGQNSVLYACVNEPDCPGDVGDGDGGVDGG